jgi:hypothetical protein
MPDFKIFTEGKADIKFLKDYVSEHFNPILSDELFYELKSWSGYKTNGHALAAIQENFDAKNETILILDADNDFANRQAEVVGDFDKFGIHANLFLFPDNKHNGNLESLLTDIAVDRIPINCFLNYEECIRAYNLSLEKSRIYAYLDTVLPANSKINRKIDLRIEENRNYRNPAHWNLHHEYLTPLHNFLQQFFP